MPSCEVPTGDVAGPHTYHILKMKTQCVGSPVLLVGWCGGPFAVGLVGLGGESN